MIKLILPGLGLAALCGAGLEAQGANAPTASTSDAASLATRAAAATDWDAVSAAYESARADWQAEYDLATDVKARRAMRDEHPAVAFWPRFEAVADAGEGRALLWMLDNAGDAGHKGMRGRKVKAAVYERLFPIHLDQGWFEQVLVNLANDRRAVGDDLFGRYLEAAATGSELPTVQARAQLVHGAWLIKSDEPEQVARGWALLEAAAEREGTDAALEAGELLYVQRNLVVGAVAPDFEGSTVDGETFRLSDYRGQVVVLDFFGFW